MEYVAIISLIITITGAAVGVALYIEHKFKEQRHNVEGRFRHRDRRLLRIEYWLKEHLGFDLSKDLPKIDDKDEK